MLKFRLMRGFAVMLVAFALAAAAAARPARAERRCAACGLLASAFGDVAEAERAAHEALARSRRRHAAQTEQTHTRRWLASESAVDLRAALEEERELACSRARLRPLRRECEALLEEDELIDALVRAAVYDEAEQLSAACGEILPRCDAAALEAAVALHAHTVRSEPVPDADRTGPHGLVRRLAGANFEGAALRRGTHVLAMLYTSDAERPCALAEANGDALTDGCWALPAEEEYLQAAPLRTLIHRARVLRTACVVLPSRWWRAALTRCMLSSGRRRSSSTSWPACATPRVRSTMCSSTCGTTRGRRCRAPRRCSARQRRAGWAVRRSAAACSWHLR